MSSPSNFWFPGLPQLGFSETLKLSQKRYYSSETPGATFKPAFGLSGEDTQNAAGEAISAWKSLSFRASSRRMRVEKPAVGFDLKERNAGPSTAFVRRGEQTSVGMTVFVVPSFSTARPSRRKHNSQVSNPRPGAPRRRMAHGLFS